MLMYARAQLHCCCTRADMPLSVTSVPGVFVGFDGRPAKIAQVDLIQQYSKDGFSVARQYEAAVHVFASRLLGPMFEVRLVQR